MRASIFPGEQLLLQWPSQLPLLAQLRKRS
jgi:hypothetical protein